jgi:hypothetical protein
MVSHLSVEGGRRKRDIYYKGRASMVTFAPIGAVKVTIRGLVRMG